MCVLTMWMKVETICRERIISDYMSMISFGARVLRAGKHYNHIQRCSVKNQTGATAVQRLW